MRHRSEFRWAIDELRRRITSGELGPETELPSEHELAEQFKLEVPRMRGVLAELANLGLLDYLPGRPLIKVPAFPAFTYFASREELGIGKRGLDNYASEVGQQGRRPANQVYAVEDTAKADVAQRLRIDEGERVVFRQMWRQIDDQHWSIETSYYPFELVAGTDLMSSEDVKRGAVAVLAEKGHKQVGYVDELTARAPTDDEVSYFELDPEARPPVPVIELWRTAFSDERPIRLTQTIFPADRNRLQYEVKDVSAYFEDRQST